jgi:hypothetical protein
MMVFTIGTVMSFTFYFFNRILKNPETAASSEPHEKGPPHPPSA